MKRYGYKEIAENIEECGFIIKVNTMPFSIPGKPDISLVELDEGQNEILLGSVSYLTFNKLLKNRVIARQVTNFSYDCYW